MKIGDIKFAISKALGKADGTNPCDIRTLDSKFYLERDDKGHYKHGKWRDKNDILQPSAFGASLFLTPHRMKQAEIDFNLWNKLVAIDVDCYKWYDVYEGGREKAPFDKVCEALRAYFRTYCSKNWLCFQKSSRDGLHIYFAFNVDITCSEDYKALAKYSETLVRDAFYRIGLAKMYDYEGVRDTCCRSPFQYTFWTPNEVFLNDTDADDFGELPIERYLYIKDTYGEYNTKTYRKRNPNVKYSVFRVEKPKKVEYIDHFERWSLFCSLSLVFSDEELREQWTRCARMIPPKHGHTTKYYEGAPYTNDWNARLDGGEWMNVALMEKFGYIVRDNAWELKRRERNKHTEYLEKLLK